MCYEEGGVCRIQCGSETYRDGEYCYRCDDEEGLCAECDGQGLCATCKKWLDREDGECIDRQQEAVDAVAAVIMKTAGHEGCEAPNVRQCAESQSGCTGTSCGTLAIEIDETGRIRKLFEANDFACG